MIYIKKLVYGVIIFLHSFIIQKINNQYLIPIYLNREIVMIPLLKQIYPYSYSFNNANEAEKVVLETNLGYKYGFKHPVEINIEIFEDDKIVTKQLII